MSTALSALETPAVLIDLDRVEHNLARAQAHADAHGLKLRPHIKTHKLPRFALRQIGLGAVGITCQTIGEAEVMADAGVTDIFLPYNILGTAKLARLAALHARITVSVGADSLATVAGYAAAFGAAGHPLPVRIECETGATRCGVIDPADAVTMARTILDSPGLAFAGIFTYPPAGRQAAAHVLLADFAAHLRAAGIAVDAISSGGTPDMWSSGNAGLAAGGVVTEYRPGTYIYFDRSQVARGTATWDDCALTVVATVVSKPTPDRCVLDSGSKALSSDLIGQTGFGRVVEYPEAAITALSEEHAVVDLSACPAARPDVGDRVTIIPNHACVVTNLFDRVNLVRGGRLVETVPVAGRRRLD